MDVDDQSLDSLEAASPFELDSSGRTRRSMSTDLGDEDFVRNSVKRERRAVTILRVAAIGVLIVAATVVSVSIFLAFTSTQEKTFESKALDSGKIAIQNFLKQFELKMWITYSKAITITSSLSSSDITARAPDLANIYFDVESFGLQNLDSSPLTFSLLIQDLSERADWEGWAAGESWVGEYNQNHGEEIVGTRIFQEENVTLDALHHWNRTIQDGIYKLIDGVPVTEPVSQGPWFPIWQVSPQRGHNTSAMFNQLSDPPRQKALLKLMDTKSPVMTEIIVGANDVYPDQDQPRSILYYPVHDNVLYGNLIGSMSMEFEWANYFNHYEFPAFTKGTIIVLENTCGQTLTYKVNGNGGATSLGMGDLHDSKFDYLMQSSLYDQYKATIIAGAVLSHNYDVNGECLYKVRTYPSQEFRANYVTSIPKEYSLAIAGIFIFTICIFVAYDFMRERLENKVIKAAVRSNAIVNSFFPAFVRERMFRSGQRLTDDVGHHLFTTTPRSHLPTATLPGPVETAKFRLKSFLTITGGAVSAREHNQNESPTVVHGTTEPIADLFPNTTVMFADISGFTAWSSEREPSQVFTLLETVYRAFDNIAKRRGVFKVETIGDCYVAVAGLPDPTADHALIMARFAYDCLKQITVLTKKLESTLGPGTGDLTMRFGLHSGPVTAGVLRGEKSRFQLFGDTVNTAARMEETSGRNDIQISPTTAALLVQANRSHWLVERDELVEVKGKGEMKTYWLRPQIAKPILDADNRSDLVAADCAVPKALPWGETSIEVQREVSNSKRKERLVEWNTEILMGLLTKIAVKRCLVDGKKQRMKSMARVAFQEGSVSEEFSLLDQVQEVIKLPTFDPSGVDKGTFRAELSPLVKSQLHDYVARIAAMYRDVPFHNFEHASHVTMSASKLMKRIINPEEVNYGKMSRRNSCRTIARAIHDCTFGLSSDPLTQFAIVFSALIHDADHTGVSNNQLIKEQTDIAIKYNGKSVAEQHSVICAWELLMEERYEALRSCIFTSEAEKDRFRQLVVNCTLATDIADRELQVLRRKRWNKAFHLKDEETPTPSAADSEDDINRKATIVIEHLIQASDVAHTMQHWHIYRKWNELLYREMYSAFKAGRSDTDPSIHWYEGELGFFDNYVIPLAKKLEKCGIFGVSSDEYLNYALENRREWEMKGRDIVVGFAAKYTTSNRKASTPAA